MTIQWSEKTLITCQITKKQKGSYLTVRIKNKIFPKAFLSWKQDQMRSDWTNVERFVDLFIKMDDLHQSDFREMRLKSKGTFTLHILQLWALALMPIWGKGVPWVFIHLLYHSSHILRTTKKYGDNFNLRVSLYTSTQNSFLVAEVFYWNKQNRMKLTPSVSNNTWTWWKRHQFKLMRQSPHIFLNVNELVRPKAK